MLLTFVYYLYVELKWWGNVIATANLFGLEVIGSQQLKQTEPDFGTHGDMDSCNILVYIHVTVVLREPITSIAKRFAAQPPQ